MRSGWSHACRRRARHAKQSAPDLLPPPRRPEHRRGGLLVHRDHLRPLRGGGRARSSPRPPCRFDGQPDSRLHRQPLRAHLHGLPHHRHGHPEQRQAQRRRQGHGGSCPPQTGHPRRHRPARPCSNLSIDALRFLYGHSLGGAFRPAEAWGCHAMPCHVRLGDIIGRAMVCIDVSIDASIVLGSIHASTDASSDDGTAVGLDASGGHTVDTITPTSLAPPRGRRRRRRPRRP